MELPRDGVESVHTFRHREWRTEWPKSYAMRYTAKYASNFYLPFGEAADSGYAFGDRKSYQMDFHNTRGDQRGRTRRRRGEDVVMVKPAIANGWLGEERIYEILVAIKRAGADLIITYREGDRERTE